MATKKKAQRKTPGKTKSIAVSITAVVDEGVTERELASVVEKSFANAKGTVKNISELAIRTLPRELGSPGAGGYEARIWEKATCRDVMNPRDKLINPERIVEERVQELAQQLDELSEKVAALAKVRKG